MGSSEFSFTQDGPRMAILHLIVLAFVAATTRAEAEAEADAQVHHGGTYGYTPVPAPVYGPEPAYHEAPVYEAAVTPFIHHEAAPVVHAAPVAHHAAHVSTVHHATMQWLTQLLTTLPLPHTMSTSLLPAPLTTPRPGAWRMPSTPPTRLNMP